VQFGDCQPEKFCSFGPWNDPQLAYYALCAGK